MQKTELIRADNIETTSGELVLILSDREVRIPWGQCSQKLDKATPQEREHAYLSPGGYGIHWSLIDEDLSISGLIRQHEGTSEVN
jgi:hypothetical protein